MNLSAGLEDCGAQVEAFHRLFARTSLQIQLYAFWSYEPEFVDLISQLGRKIEEPEAFGPALPWDAKLVE
jgi:hypothetical protein